MPVWIQLAIGAAAVLAIWDRISKTGASVAETIAEVPEKIKEAVITYEKVQDAYGGTRVLCHRPGKDPHPIYWPAGEEPDQEEIARILKMYGCSYFTSGSSAEPQTQPPNAGPQIL